MVDKSNQRAATPHFHLQNLDPPMNLRVIPYEASLQTARRHNFKVSARSVVLPKVTGLGWLTG